MGNSNSLSRKEVRQKTIRTAGIDRGALNIERAPIGQFINGQRNPVFPKYKAWEKKGRK